MKVAFSVAVVFIVTYLSYKPYHIAATTTAAPSTNGTSVNGTTNFTTTYVATMAFGQMKPSAAGTVQQVNMSSVDCFQLCRQTTGCLGFASARLEMVGDCELYDTAITSGDVTANNEFNYYTI